MAQTYQVAQVISMFGYIEVSETNDVMNVKLFPKLGLSNAALLAGIPITFSCPSALPLPVGAVIRQITATPCGIIGAAIPSICTVGRAKAESSCAFECGWNLYMLATVFAIVLGHWFSWWTWRNQSVFSSLLIAISGAYCNEFSTNLKRFTGKFFSAYLADVRITIALVFATQLIGALTTACCLPAKLKAFRIGKIGFTAYGTNSFYHVQMIA